MLKPFKGYTLLVISLGVLQSNLKKIITLIS